MQKMLIISRDILIASTAKKQFCIKKKGDLTLVYDIPGLWGELSSIIIAFIVSVIVQYEKFLSQPTETLGRLSR